MARSMRLTSTIDWNTITREEIDMTDGNPAGAVSAYLGGKALAERRLWEIAEENPQVDFTSSKYTTKDPFYLLYYFTVRRQKINII